MKTLDTKYRNNKTVLVLGPESDGNFSFYKEGKVYFIDGFDDLLDGDNFKTFQEAVLDFVNKNGKPDVIISDLHPLFHTTSWGKELSKKFNAEFVQVQHHLAHVMSAVGDFCLNHPCHPERSDNGVEGSLSNEKKGFLHSSLREIGRNDKCGFLGIACDGTGYGLDEKIWGGEVFKISNFQFPHLRNASDGQAISNKRSKPKFQRIGKLENQVLIGGELAIKEPARMLISILGKFLDKDEVYEFVKDYYDKNQFELLWNQWKEGFNCLETSSTGRVLDAVSVLLGFSGNERPYKHAPIDMLEKNSTEPYAIEPPLLSSRAQWNGVEGSLSNEKKGFLHLSLREIGLPRQVKAGRNDKMQELQTTPLFEYLVNNLDKDKEKLAGTAQMYLAKGLWEICASSLCHPERSGTESRNPLVTRKRDFSTIAPMAIGESVEMTMPVFFAGGIANNKIVSEYLCSKGVIVSKKIPRGDGGISFGQLMYYLANTGD